MDCISINIPPSCDQCLVLADTLSFFEAFRVSPLAWARVLAAQGWRHPLYPDVAPSADPAGDLIAEAAAEGTWAAVATETLGRFSFASRMRARVMTQPDGAVWLYVDFGASHLHAAKSMLRALVQHGIIGADSLLADVEAEWQCRDSMEEVAHA